MTPLVSRIFTAVVLLAVFVSAVLWAPGWLWQVLVAGIAGLAAYEWARLSAFPTLSARLYATAIAACALVLPELLADGWPAFQTGLFLLAAASLPPSG